MTDALDRWEMTVDERLSKAWKRGEYKIKATEGSIFATEYDGWLVSALHQTTINSYLLIDDDWQIETYGDEYMWAVTRLAERLNERIKQ